jgi:glycosyltransferase involved in cell wall biosynthesis
MHLLFIHQAFPAQFGRLALELTKRYGWQCSFVVRHLSRCPTPTAEMIERLQIIALPPDPKQAVLAPWPSSLANFLALCGTVHDVVRSRPDLRPDLVVSHCGLGPSLFLHEVLSCPFVHYFEYYLGRPHRDLTYRVDLPPVPFAPFYPRCINAGTLLGLVDVPRGYTPTHYQRQSFPERFRSRIEVHFDGIDTELYRLRRGQAASAQLTSLLGGRALPDGTRLVTFVARGLESMRGFDLFLRLAGRISRQRPDVLFAVAGGDMSYYGWDQQITGGISFKQWAQARGDCDPARLVFLGQVEPEQLAVVLARSDLHVFLTVPFVLSWSLFNALACGCVVLAADVEPVREVIEPGVNGLVGALFDIDQLTETALRVLADPAIYRPLGQAARARMEEHYSLEVAVPALKTYFERQARGEGG